MKKITTILLMSLPLLGYSQQSGLQKDFTGMISYNEQQVLSLAEAIPDDKFNWRPADGVRSVAEVLLHLASANYFITMGMGFEPPQGVDVKKIESLTERKEIMETLKSSFAYVKEKAALIADKDLEDKFTLPFGEFTKRNGLLILLDHSGEHKGQLIAYARMNGITPPWSKKGDD